MGISLLHKAGSKSSASGSGGPEPEFQEEPSAAGAVEKQEILKNINELKTQLSDVQKLINKLE